MLEVTGDPLLLPITGPKPLDLDAFVSPTPNLVNGYNIAEQTCFHKTTVGNLVPSLRALSSGFKGLSTLVQLTTQIVTDVVRLVTDSIILVGRTTTLLAAVTSLVTTVTGLVTTIAGLITAIVGSITAIIGSLTSIRTGAIIAAIAAAVAGALCAFFWVPFAGYGFLAAGAIATAVLLAVVFILISIALGTILGSLGTITGTLGTLTTAIGTLTAPLGTVNTAIVGVNGILTNPALPSDISRDLTAVQGSLAPLLQDLPIELALFNGTVGILDQRATVLQSFLLATLPGQPIVPRAHLEDTYLQAVKIYNDAITALQAAVGSGVLGGMLNNPTNKPQITPNNVVDKTLACVVPGPNR